MVLTLFFYRLGNLRLDRKGLSEIIKAKGDMKSDMEGKSQCSNI